VLARQHDTKRCPKTRNETSRRGVTKRRDSATVGLIADDLSGHVVALARFGTFRTLPHVDMRARYGAVHVGVSGYIGCGRQAVAAGESSPEKADRSERERQ
jgi:hypothetical protein